MTFPYSTSKTRPIHGYLQDPDMRERIFNRNNAFTKDPATYSVGVSNAMTMTIAPEAHRAKRQVLDPCFSKRRVNMMEESMHSEIGRVFDKVDQYVALGDEVPIHELLYCYTVFSPAENNNFSHLATWLTSCRQILSLSCSLARV